MGHYNLSMNRENQLWKSGLDESIVIQDNFQRQHVLGPNKVGYTRFGNVHEIEFTIS